MDIYGYAPRSHPRSLRWLGTTAFAMGGSNQSLFLIAALFAGQDGSPGQGSATIALLFVGLMLSYAAAPGWTELVLMSPERVGGISAACTAAFKPYSPVLSALATTCYWWGWVPTCGITAILSATAMQQWCLPSVSVPLLACFIVVVFAGINLAGIRLASKVASIFAVASASLAAISMFAPVLTGHVDWHRAADLHLTTPFPGWFGTVTSLMAGLYLIGFGAPAFEAAACHVGETIDPNQNVPRAMLASAVMALAYFVFLPIVWLSTLGPEAMGKDLGDVLGPTFAPLFGVAGKSAAIGFMMFNMFHGTLQPLAGASRALAQSSEDGLAPRFLAWRLPNDAPWAAIMVTAGFAIVFLVLGDPIWLIAAANFTYLIGICLPSVAVWLLRRDAPDVERPFRAPRGTVVLGLVAAFVWGGSALLGFEQFGLPTVVFGVLMAYSGAGIYGLRKLEDRWRDGASGFGRSLHVKLTVAMLIVLALDASGYLLAVNAVSHTSAAYMAVLEDIFVAVAFLTISVGIVLPGIIAHSAMQVSEAARGLAFGTVRDLASAMAALAQGRLEEAVASIEVVPVVVRSADELGEMAASFNTLQQGVKEAAICLDQARMGLSTARNDLLTANAELRSAKEAAIFDAMHDSLTGLPNRAFFIDRLDEELFKRCSPSDDIWAVLFIDLDGFKIVNDSLGHEAGNSLIVQVATRIRDLLDEDRRSSSDLKRNGHILARLGGDEFTVLLGQVKGSDEAASIAKRIVQRLSLPFVVKGEEVNTGASIGIVADCRGYTSHNDILRDADLAMYRAKSLGKARAEVFHVAMHETATTRLHLQSDLWRAIREEEFLLHYQPIVCLKTKEVSGFEALVRWKAPGRELAYPNTFIHMAEETGIIVPLGLWVLREACKTCKSWQTLGGHEKLSMSINLSPRQFAQQDLVASVAAILSETAVDTASIKLEITESSTMGDPERAIHVFAELKALGVDLSIDDFGTGFSSLSYLHRFPLDILKIDRSFVSGMINSRESRQVVSTILALSEGLGLEVIAEGIEFEEQSDELDRLGCKYGQGYFFAKPMPEGDILAMLQISQFKAAVADLKAGELKLTRPMVRLPADATRPSLFATVS